MPRLCCLALVLSAPPAAADNSERQQVLGAFLAEHWALPVPPQGARPAHFEPGEESLDPAVCGACHPKQLSEWQTSLHAQAYSPGLAAQLIEGPLAGAAETRACLRCHSPLAEQQPLTEGGQRNAEYSSSLQAQGVLCAGCHVREHRRFGPPRPQGPRESTDILQSAARSPRLPHDGFEPRPEFAESRFCAPCHQFFDDVGVNGKPLENTYTEWTESPQAAAGDTCQSCHMPSRSHRWQGIHDPDFVRAAVAAELFDLGSNFEQIDAALVIQSRSVGHAFPTYVTPRVTLAIWQSDGAGRALPGTRLEAAIARVVDLASDPPREQTDSRLSPNESAKLEYRRPRAAAAQHLRGEVLVDPDAHYRAVYQVLLGSLRDKEARALAEAAQSRIAESAYRLFEFDLALPRPSPH